MYLFSINLYMVEQILVLFYMQYANVCIRGIGMVTQMRLIKINREQFWVTLYFFFSALLFGPLRHFRYKSRHIYLRTVRLTWHCPLYIHLSHWLLRGVTGVHYTIGVETKKVAHRANGLTGAQKGSPGHQGSSGLTMAHGWGHFFCAKMSFANCLWLAGAHKCSPGFQRAHDWFTKKKTSCTSLRLLSD